MTGGPVYHSRLLRTIVSKSSGMIEVHLFVVWDGMKIALVGTVLTTAD
jgi:hypothetical protein